MSAAADIEPTVIRIGAQCLAAELSPMPLMGSWTLCLDPFIEKVSVMWQDF